ncbi:MAG: type II toxin-antitoxin system toxin endoribonuclease MazF9 [Acidimicrobiia bacterium]|nr:MAG: type II toxin-antitoxin system toxin endoribonuclease MazF9 [Acidimicrobiia bacterium]
MLRGEIRMVYLDSVRSGEANKTRPAVIVSNDGANGAAAQSNRGVVTVLPLTSNVSHVYPFQVLIRATEAGLDRDSKVQAEQVRSVSVGRILTRIGRIPPDRMEEVDEALRLHLAL